jgi:hypothetical protein
MPPADAGADPTPLGPWDVAGYEVRIEVADRARLVAFREGKRLKTLPQPLRESDDLAWLKLSLTAVHRHQRTLKAILEDTMAQQAPLSAEDLAGLALDPVGRSILGGLLVEVDGVIGLPLPDEWLLETLGGDLLRLGHPARVVHPATLMTRGTLDRWHRWRGGRWLRQPFKQIRRELYVPDAADSVARTHSNRVAGACVRWDQARAILEGRGWHRVTKTAAERAFRRAKLDAFLEFRTPASRGFTREDVLLGRVYFLPQGERIQNRAHPGIPLADVPLILFSEVLRDAGLVARAASRKEPDE